MAGHSKWANIKHRKERADGKKGKLFSRITKEIISAVKQGGGDPKANSKLRIAIQKAKEANLPSDNIERNIKKASNPDQGDFTTITYELYGHGGVGIIVEAMTDNKNRLASDIRIATNKRGGVIATPGSVLFNFERKGIIHLAKQEVDDEALWMWVIEAGAEEFVVREIGYLVVTTVECLGGVQQQLLARHLVIEAAEIEMIPKTYVICDEETREANQALLEWLDNIDDVDALYHNMREEQVKVDPL
jgi:YebC/PmpR family DNA-binding regulatory protein